MTFWTGRSSKKSNLVFLVVIIVALGISLASLCILSKSLADTDVVIENELNEIIAIEKLEIVV